ncbi:MAG: fibronectin type III domain-containing protein, partial [Spirochaetales bacterium]|nr:fibronectin type III domain-containing protein [Spirochaetales bacterium]
ILPRYPEIAQTMSREADRRRKANEEKIDHRDSPPEENPQEENSPREASSKKNAPEEEQAKTVLTTAELKTLPPIEEVEFSLLDDEDIIKLRWKEMDDVNYYQVLKKNPRGEKWAFSASQLYSPEFIDLHPLKSGKNIYKLRAVNENGPGPWSRGFYFSFEEGAGTE